MTGRREEAKIFFQGTGIRALSFFNIFLTSGMSFGESMRMHTTDQQEQFTQLWTQAQSTVA
jgi:hypothetical protein